MKFKRYAIEGISIKLTVTEPNSKILKGNWGQAIHHEHGGWSVFVGGHLNKEDFTTTLIHELLHVSIPQAIETQVRKAAIVIN